MSAANRKVQKLADLEQPVPRPEDEPEVTMKTLRDLLHSVIAINTRLEASLGDHGFCKQVLEQYQAQVEVPIAELRGLQQTIAQVRSLTMLNLLARENGEIHSANAAIKEIMRLTR